MAETMTNSILLSIKRMLGYDVEYDPANPFDLEIVMHINAQLATLRQVGVGPKNGFRISSDSETWTDFLSGQYDEFNEMAKEFVWAKVKLAFDPPANSSAIESLKSLADEDLWRAREKAEGVFDSE